jgi:hypothetical protein
VRQLAVFQSRPVSRLRYTQLGVLARPLTRMTPGEGVEFGTTRADWGTRRQPPYDEPGNSCVTKSRQPASS